MWRETGDVNPGHKGGANGNADDKKPTRVFVFHLLGLIFLMNKCLDLLLD